jgi:hypothetical protein
MTRFLCIKLVQIYIKLLKKMEIFKANVNQLSWGFIRKPGRIGIDKQITMDQLDLHARVLELTKAGLDPRKARNSVLFHSPETPIHVAFNHKRYGYIRKKDGDALFHKHVTHATSWFRSKVDGVGPRDRAMNKERNIRQGLTTAA